MSLIFFCFPFTLERVNQWSPKIYISTMHPVHVWKLHTLNVHLQNQSRNPGPWISRLVAFAKTSELCLASEPTWVPWLWWRSQLQICDWFHGEIYLSKTASPATGLEPQPCQDSLCVASPALQQTLSPTPSPKTHQPVGYPAPKIFSSPALAATWWYHSAKFTEDTQWLLLTCYWWPPMSETYWPWNKYFRLHFKKVKSEFSEATTENSIQVP